MVTDGQIESETMNTTQRGLETCADTIDGVLKQNGIMARVDGGIVQLRAVVFRVSKSLPGGSGLADMLALALNVPGVRLDDRDIVVKRNDASAIKLLALLTRLAKDRLPAYTATLGMCDDGAPLLVRLSSTDVGHVLIAGPDGCGKSSLMRTIAVSLAMFNRSRYLKLILIGKSFSDLSGLPHAATYTTRDLLLIFNRPYPSPHIVVLVDDLIAADESMTLVSADWHKSGVHVVASGSLSSYGFGTVITGNGEPGDFTATTSESKDLIHFQSAYITSAEAELVVRRS
jgi:hypothetical protein